MQGEEIEKIEKEWNELGKDGWRFCMEDKFARLIFMREIKDGELTEDGIDDKVRRILTVKHKYLQ